MSEPATPQTEAPVQPNVAIDNLRGALDSIARNDLNTESSLTERPPNPSDPIPTHAINGTDSQTESSPKDVEEKQASAEDSQPEGDSAKIRWKELKQAEKDLKLAQKELSELKKRGEEFETTSQEVQRLKEQIQAIEQEREALDGELYISRVQASKEYNKFVTEPLNQLFDDVDFYAGRNNVDGGDIISALEADVNGNPQALEQLLADWSDRDKTKVYQLADNLLSIQKRRGEIESNSKAAYQASLELEKAEQDQQMQQYFAQRETAVNTVIPRLSEKVFGLLPEDKRPDIAKLQEEIMGYDQWPEDLKVYGIAGAAILPDLVDRITSLQAEIETVRNENIRIRGGAAPAAGGVSPRSPADTNKPVDYTKVDTDDFVKGLVSRIRA
jgi:hypothetical protein